MLYFHCLDNHSNKRVRKFNRMLEKLHERPGAYVSDLILGRHLIIKLHYLNTHTPTIHATRFYFGPDRTYSYWGKVDERFVPRVYRHMSGAFPNAASVPDQHLAQCERMFFPWN